MAWGPWVMLAGAKDWTQSLERRWAQGFPSCRPPGGAVCTLLSRPLWMVTVAPV